MYLSSNFEKCGQSVAKVAKEMLNIIVVQTWDHDWNQISRDVGIKLLSGCRHQTSSRIAVAFKLLEDVNDIELVAL